MNPTLLHRSLRRQGKGQRLRILEVDVSALDAPAFTGEPAPADKGCCYWSRTCTTCPYESCLIETCEPSLRKEARARAALLLAVQGASNEVIGEHLRVAPVTVAFWIRQAVRLQVRRASGRGNGHELGPPGVPVCWTRTVVRVGQCTRCRGTAYEDPWDGWKCINCGRPVQMSKGAA